MKIKKMSHIMLLTLGYSPEISGGVGTHVKELALALNSEGIKVTVLAHSPANTKVINDEGVAVHYIRAGKNTLANNCSWAQGILAFNDDMYSYAVKLIEEEKPDIVHYHHWYTFKAARKIKEAFKLPTIGTIHYLTYPIETWWGQEPDREIGENEQEWFSSNESFISVSQSMYKIIEGYYPEIKDKVTVIRTSISLDVFLSKNLSGEKRNALRQKLGGAGKKYVLFAGRINKQKGIIPLIDSAALVQKEIPHVHYILAGQSDSRDYFNHVKKHLEQYDGLKDKFTFLGNIPREQLALLFQGVHISIFPSIYEPLGLVALEAMAAGSVPVVSGGGGLEESVQHEKTGLVVPVHWREKAGQFEIDIKKLAQAQVELLLDEKKRRKLSIAGKKYVAEEYTFTQSTLHPTLKIYEKTILDYYNKR